MSGAFYRLTAPVEWATTVEALSFSSLRALERCPRQWQLQRSRWPGFERFPARRHAATVAGTIAHAMLDRIFRALALRGLPRQGSAAFREVLAEIDVMGALRGEIAAWNEELAEHPRAASMRAALTERTLYNTVARLFQAEYATVDPTVAEPPRPTAGVATGAVDPGELLARRGVLTELPVRHPSLPLRGVIDLLRRDGAGTHVVDFKTGAARPEYRDQLELYALLWWRTAGDLPASLELRHPQGRSAFPVDAERLTALEAGLGQRIAAAREALAAPPAPAIPGGHCAHCDVRPFCDAYWQALAPPDPKHTGAERWVDATVVVPDEVGANGFVATVPPGRRLPVVYDDEGAGVHGPFAPGETLRILAAVAPIGGSELRLVRTTEVFHR